MRSLFVLALLASTIASTNISFAQSAETSLSTPIEIPATTAPSAPTEDLTIDQIRAVVRDEIRKNPKLILDAVNAYSVEAQRNQEAADHKITLENKDLITVSEGYPVFGNPAGKVSVFYFYDVNCTYCKKLEPDLARFVGDNPDVKLVLREMPILTTNVPGDSSRYAAQIGGVMAVLYPKEYPKLHSKLMAMNPGIKNNDIDRTVVEVLGPVKGSELLVRALQVDEDELAKAVAGRIAATLDTATKSKINGTPFVFVAGSNGILRGASATAYDDLGAMVRDARALAVK
jgi:protein-disulfide isomerase